LGGAYRVGQLLGEGSMGSVYEGVQESLNRKVAIKVLKTRGQLSQATLARFAREAHATAELGHPNIVLVTDFQSREGEPPFLVMERLVGHSLREVISQEKRLPEGRVAFIANQVLDALSAAHAASVVHRDIKPDNVFLTRLAAIDDIVKVLDFGVAKLTTEGALTAHGARVGSPAYMSPEQAAGRPVDARTDLYCLGATMYHALTGHLPFETQNLAELLTWLETRPAPPMSTHVPSIDARIAAVVERAMAKDPNVRFPSAEAMKEALAPLLRPRESWSGPHVPGPLPHVAQAPQPTPRNPVAPPPPVAPSSMTAPLGDGDRVSHVPFSTSHGPLGRPMPVGVPPVVSGNPGVPMPSGLPVPSPMPAAPYGTPSPYGTPPPLAPSGWARASHAPSPPYGAAAAPMATLPVTNGPGYGAPGIAPSGLASGPYPTYATGAYPAAATEGASAWKIAAGIAVWKLGIFFVLGALLVFGAAVVFFVFR
jgi:serine/threonine-protein kinase